jgi:SAM-dependent methyltransferase
VSADFDEEYYVSANPDVLLALKRGLVRTGWEHYMRFGKDEGRAGLPPDPGSIRRGRSEHRQAARHYVTGSGIEIGALDRPFEVSPDARVTYCDRFTPDESREILTGLGTRELARVDRVIDLNAGLADFSTESQDFVIACNVLQHVANPIRCLEEMFRITRPSGHVVLAAPDKRHSFEASRSVTPFDHVLEEYLQNVTEVSDAHYVDLLVLFCPSDVALGVSTIGQRLGDFRRRLEHAHVWDSSAFRELVTRGCRVVDVEAKIVLEATGDETASECLIVLQKVRQLLQ